MPLDQNQKERYSRMIALRDINESDVERVLRSSVAMVGAGGIGSPTLRLLTSLGFGTIRIIDKDNVELHNLQRQNIYTTKDLGKPKATAAAANLSSLNKDIKFEPIVEEITKENSLAFLNDIDVIVDGLDSFSARHVVNQASIRYRTPYVFSGAVEYFSNISTFIPGVTGCFECTFSGVEDAPRAKAENIGVSPSLLTLISGIVAQETFLIVIGKPPKLAGKMMTIDIHSLSFDLIEIERNPDCLFCSNI
ncbi:MAG: ThiF family adenylyltransferase [Candidatus Thorarchaeota archaeon]